MRNNWSKGLTGFILLLLIFPLVTYVIADDDDSRGDMALDLDNDPPVFIEWEEATAIVTENLDFLFYVVIEDIDNTSSELNVTLFYSNNLFVSDNNTINMTYESSPATNQYRFIYWFSGQPAVTTYDFYYVAFDGETQVRKPTTEGYYYNIQWGTAVRPDGFERYPRRIPLIEWIGVNLPLMLFAMLTVVMLFSSMFILVHQRRTEDLVVPSDASMPRIAYAYGAFYIRQSAKLIRNGLSSITKRGFVTGRQVGKDVTLSIHARATTRAKPEVVGTQDKIKLMQAGEPLPLRTQVKNVFIGIFSDAKYLAKRIQYQGSRAFARITGRPMPKTTKPQRYVYKNPLAVQYRKFRGRMVAADHKLQRAQKRIPTAPNRMAAKTQKKAGFLTRLNKRLKKTERRINRYAQGRNQKKKANGKFRRPHN